jgi:galactose mutarotase-like enzyme
MFYLENGSLRIGIHPKGAELQQLFHKGNQTEYMWNGDPAFWNRHSPLLFPIVGTLRDNTYFYKDRSYTLPRHGFARDREFAVESKGEDRITFLMLSDEATKVVFPFDFVLRVSYRLLPEGVSVTYQVDNPSTAEPLYFSVGGHPAFRVPLAPDTAYNDYFLEFDETETAPRWPISREGLIEREPRPLLEDTRMLALTKQLFAKDALVLKRLRSTGVALGSYKTRLGLRLDFPGFPYLGIWAAPNADFVCIEPWCGIADAVDTDRQWTHKEGINRLEPRGTFGRTWTVQLF